MEAPTRRPSSSLGRLLVWAALVVLAFYFVFLGGGWVGIHSVDLRTTVLLRPSGLQRGLRDVRLLPSGGFRNVVYHLAIFTGRTEMGLADFRPQAAEIDELRYFAPDEIDRMLLRGHLAPNMAFLWLTQARDLLQLASRGRR